MKLIQQRCLSLTLLWAVGTIAVATPVACGLSMFRYRMTFALLTGLSAGVMIGVAWLHLLADSQEAFEYTRRDANDCSSDAYPWANLALACGTLVMALIDCATARPELVDLPRSSSDG